MEVLGILLVYDDMVSTIFSKDDAETICALPLSKTGGTDRLVWHYDRKGVYTVKSGYKLMCCPTAGDGDEPSNRQNLPGKKVWELLWQAKVPTKIRVFAWKAMNDILPTFDNLYRRKIDVERQCSRCFGQNETTLHVLRDCAFADGVWKLRNFCWTHVDRDQDSILSWMHMVMANSDQDFLQRFMILIWALWNARNEFIHGEQSRSMKDVSLFAEKYAKELNDAQLSNDGSIHTASHRWTPPPEGKFKINFDGGLNTAYREGGIGMVIRDSRGVIVGASAQKIPNVSDPFTIEAIGAVRALEFARNIGLTSVMLEGDALCIIRKLSSLEQDLSPIGPLIDEARFLIKHFDLCEVGHVLRANNMVAHQLAKYSLFSHQDMFWIAECPDFVHSLVIADFISNE